MFKSLSILGALAVVVGAEFTVIARRENPPTGFSRVGSSAADQTLNLRLALVQKNISGLQDTVYGVSTPGSSRYGQYLSKEEVEAYVAPTDDTVSQVNAWLASNNLTSSPMTSAGDWIAVNIHQSNRAQNSLLFCSTHIEGQYQGRSSNYHVGLLPQRKLSSSVANTTATTAKAAPLRASITPDCILSWTPACFQALYGIPSTPAAPAANVFAVAGFQNDFANLRDVQAFLQTFRPDLNPNPTVTLIRNSLSSS
ncbi:Pro-kumamolisin, activation domain-containing protein [Mycena alexandri]|uniref:Pro-kumamolisin, activation domain-containing protein n=1 Tax=Mycena alexandri TaxID=1745969 RepID=A0AAD6S1M9_9AGAR|nr:Pro-kumamolisin, activation domain-containing protein [Mycena alexandri]